MEFLQNHASLPLVWDIFLHSVNTFHLLFCYFFQNIEAIKAPTMETTPSPITADDDDDDSSLFSIVNTPSLPSASSSVFEVSNVSHPTSVRVILVHVKLLHPLSKFV
mmetsp:Transcript_17233/g.30994  ORF Transcript_17233/g.30994 Transcript_17233/m.30994 type:complete len:107 (+) Transcript_17233:30-350(+)